MKKRLAAFRNALLAYTPIERENRRNMQKFRKFKSEFKNSFLYFIAIIIIIIIIHVDSISNVFKIGNIKYKNRIRNNLTIKKRNFEKNLQLENYESI